MSDDFEKLYNTRTAMYFELIEENGQLESQLTRTQKALDVAKAFLANIDDCEGWHDPANEALEKINEVMK